MIRRLCHLTLALILLLGACGKDEETPQERAERGRRAQVEQVRPDIARVVIEPAEPTSSSLLRALTTLKIERLQNVRFHHRWFVNDREVQGIGVAVLQESSFKRGDRVQCVVTAVRGRLSSRPVRSPRVTILNSPPEINKILPLEGDRDPGRLVYQIVAVDHDGDEIRFNLRSPLDRGILLDPVTGRMECSLEPEPRGEHTDAEKHAEQGDPAPMTDIDLERYYERLSRDGEELAFLEVVIEASDTQGGRTIYTLAVDLESGQEVTH